MNTTKKIQARDRYVLAVNRSNVVLVLFLFYPKREKKPFTVDYYYKFLTGGDYIIDGKMDTVLFFARVTISFKF